MSKEQQLNILLKRLARKELARRILSAIRKNAIKQ